MSFGYFVASLPTPALGAPAPLSLAQFRADAARLLPRDAVAEMDAVLAGDRSAARSAFAAQWFDVETQLRNAVARTRAARRDVEAAPYLHPHGGFRVSIEDAVSSAYAKPNPLEREMALDRARWSAADEFSLFEPFGIGAVLAYAVKLRIAERWASLSDDAGRSALEDAVSRVRGAAAKAPAA